MFGKLGKKKADAEKAEPKSDLEGQARRESQPPVRPACPTCGNPSGLEVCPIDGTQLIYP